MSKRRKFSDPRPDNVTIPAPPGHRRRIEILGADLSRIHCQCGWVSLALPGLEAERAYDRHIESFDWCDFCGGLWPLVKEYESETFSVDFGTVDAKGSPQLFVYEGNWLACEPCAKLIDADSWRPLAERSVERVLITEVALQPWELDLVRQTPSFRESVARIAYLHQCFNGHRKR